MSMEGMLTNKHYCLTVKKACLLNLLIFSLTRNDI